MQYSSYVFAETLRDGTAVTVRAAGANDGPKIRRAFLNLERDTVYTRFFGYKADVSDAELGRITGADFACRTRLWYSAQYAYVCICNVRRKRRNCPAGTDPTLCRWPAG